MAHFPSNIGGLCPFDKAPEPVTVPLPFLRTVMPGVVNASKRSLSFCNDPEAARPMHLRMESLIRQDPKLVNKVGTFILNDKDIVFASEKAIPQEQLDEVARKLTLGAFLGLRQPQPIDSTEVPSAETQLSDTDAYNGVYPAINGAWR